MASGSKKEEVVSLQDQKAAEKLMRQWAKEEAAAQKAAKKPKV